uniref:Auxin response factor 19-like n=1 Tax=Rhizophora mucronata TaxID=61149 RepID=A0A2P2III3_RHIMU
MENSRKIPHIMFHMGWTLIANWGYL